MKRTFFFITVTLMAAGLQAEIITRDEVSADNIDKMAGSLYQYVAPTRPLTPAPKGFKPFYRWQDVRAYYLAKISYWEEYKKKEAAAK